MGDVIELNSETLFYIKDSNNIGRFKGVGDSDCMVELINNDEKGTVFIYADGDPEVSKEKFKSLCIAWLALSYPDVLNCD